MYKHFNPNPLNNYVGDCTVRAIAKGTGKNWQTTYMGLALKGYEMADMPSSNQVWDAYLRQKGFVRYSVPNECPECYTLKDFCRQYPKGMYVVALPSHVVAVNDGDYYDAWDSGNETPIYYYKKES
jgi:hypothetical protein